MTPEDLKQIEQLIRKHKPDDASLFVLILFLLFLGGCFKNCGGY